ncbi:hypothetical protein ACJX0J_033119, partial [Zea mays]
NMVGFGLSNFSSVSCITPHILMIYDRFSLILLLNDEVESGLLTCGKMKQNQSIFILYKFWVYFWEEKICLNSLFLVAYYMYESLSYRYRLILYIVLFLEPSSIIHNESIDTIQTLSYESYRYRLVLYIVLFLGPSSIIHNRSIDKVAFPIFFVDIMSTKLFSLGVLCCHLTYQRYELDK